MAAAAAAPVFMKTFELARLEDLGTFLGWGCLCDYMWLKYKSNDAYMHEDAIYFISLRISKKKKKVHRLIVRKSSLR